MLTGSAVFAASLGYVCLLFFIAWWGDREGRRFLTGGRRTLVYALSLAVYCTSWTYYGSVGLASARGLDFLPIYIGPILIIGLGYRLIQRIAGLARDQNLTTVADFVSARYGKSQIVAALAALIALMASAPYIALQLKAITQTILMVLESFQHGRLTPGAPSPQFSLVVAALLAVFAMAFGTRRINPTEHQQGLILAIAVESVVKLVAFLAVGAFVVWGLFGGLGELSNLARSPRISQVLSTPPDPGNWIITTLLSASAILLLPRQFHVTVVENVDKRDIRKAATLFPIYLVLINLFVVPLAIAGLTLFPDGAIDRDLTVLALPLSAGARALALTTMIGGLSAATGMVVVDSVALAITVSNDLVMPILLRRRSAQADAAAGEIGARVLTVRRIAILFVLTLGYLYARLASGAALASIGLLSFAALAQILPAFMGGLIWRRGTARGAAAGMIVGSLVWLYVLFLPSLAAEGALADVLNAGPLGVAWLRPSALVSFSAFPLVGGVVLSLGAQHPGLPRLLDDAAGDAAGAHAGRGLRRNKPRRQTAGVPALARDRDGRRSRGDAGALSGRAARAARLRRLLRRARRTAERQRRGGRAADPPCRASALARDRRLDLASRALPAAAPARDVGQVGAETARRRLGGDPVEPRPVAARARPCAPGHHGVRLQSRPDDLEPRIRRIVRPARADASPRRRARRDRALQCGARDLWAGRFRRLRRRAHREPAQ